MRLTSVKSSVRTLLRVYGGFLKNYDSAIFLIGQRNMTDRHYLLTNRVCLYWSNWKL